MCTTTVWCKCDFARAQSQKKIVSRWIFEKSFFFTLGVLQSRRLWPCHDCYPQWQLICFCEAGCHSFSNQEGLKWIQMIFMCMWLKLLHFHLDLCQCHPCVGKCKSCAPLLAILNLLIKCPISSIASHRCKSTAIVAAKSHFQRKTILCIQGVYIPEILLHFSAAFILFCPTAVDERSVKASNMRPLNLTVITSLIQTLTAWRNSRIKFCIAEFTTF